jgi:hypothetical protein
VKDLPPYVARSGDRIGQLGLRPLAGVALPNGDLPRLASDLLDEVEERRRTFPVARRIYDSLASELSADRERVRQLETSAPQQLARAAGIARCAGARHRSPDLGCPLRRDPRRYRRG